MALRAIVTVASTLVVGAVVYFGAFMVCVLPYMSPGTTARPGAFCKILYPPPKPPSDERVAADLFKNAARASAQAALSPLIQLFDTGTEDAPVHLVGWISPKEPVQCLIRRSRSVLLDDEAWPLELAWSSRSSAGTVVPEVCSKTLLVTLDQAKAFRDHVAKEPSGAREITCAAYHVLPPQKPVRTETAWFAEIKVAVQGETLTAENLVVAHRDLLSQMDASGLVVGAQPIVRLNSSVTLTALQTERCEGYSILNLRAEKPRH